VGIVVVLNMVKGRLTRSYSDSCHQIQNNNTQMVRAQFSYNWETMGQLKPLLQVNNNDSLTPHVPTRTTHAAEKQNMHRMPLSETMPKHRGCNCPHHCSITVRSQSKKRCSLRCLLRACANAGCKATHLICTHPDHSRAPYTAACGRARSSVANPWLSAPGHEAR